MPKEQKAIYYITGDDLQKMKESPYLEKLKEKGFEVLLLVDPIDEWVVEHIKEYEKVPLQSITHENLDLESNKTDMTKDKQKGEQSIEEYKELQPLLQKLKEFLKEEIQEVKISYRLTQSPVCLVASEKSPSAHMQKILAQMNQRGNLPKSFMEKRILEINPNHPLINKLVTLPEERQKQWACILFNQALLMEGSTPSKPSDFSKAVNSILLDS